MSAEPRLESFYPPFAAGIDLPHQGEVDSHNLHSMETLPSEIKHYILQRQYTMWHAAGATNPTQSDMSIETTFMRYGYSQGGLTGIALAENATQRWSNSLHTWSSLITDITAMRNQRP